MKRLYITGLAGMLGSNLAYLLKDKYEIYGCDRNKVAMSGIHSSVFDLLLEDQMEQEILTIKPDIIINTAAFVNVDGCEAQKDLAEAMNAKLPKRLVSVCKKISATLIQISSDAVYSDKEMDLHKEESEIDPVNVYGRTKYEGEKPVLAYEKGMVLRTNIYGFNVQDKFSFGEWILDALQNNKELRMVEDVYFSPILVNDLAEVIHLLIEKQIFGLYNACATGSISKYDFGIFMREIFHYPNAVIHKVSSKDLKLQAPRSKNMGMSNRKLKEMFNGIFRTPEESIEYFRELYEMGYQKKLKEFGGRF